MILLIDRWLIQYLFLFAYSNDIDVLLDVRNNLLEIVETFKDAIRENNSEFMFNRSQNSNLIQRIESEFLECCVEFEGLKIHLFEVGHHFQDSALNLHS